MNNKIMVALVLIIVVIGGFFYFSKKQSQPSQQPTSQQPENKVEANTITIENFSFNPGTLTIKQGTKITWTNKDSAPHKIKSETFNSLDLNQGDKFEFTFDKKGSFDYFCSIHPSMSGKIVVE